MGNEVTILTFRTFQYGYTQNGREQNYEEIYIISLPKFKIFKRPTRYALCSASKTQHVLFELAI